MSSYLSYAVDLLGKKKDVEVIDGVTFLTTGERLPVGYTVQTEGGIWKMTEKGGIQVEQHNMYTPVENVSTNYKPENSVTENVSPIGEVDVEGITENLKEGVSSVIESIKKIIQRFLFFHKFIITL